MILLSLIKLKIKFTCLVQNFYCRNSIPFYEAFDAKLFKNFLNYVDINLNQGEIFNLKL